MHFLVHTYESSLEWNILVNGLYLGAEYLGSASHLGL